jgi:NADH:ubiquinone oxidoreductase subunit 3 (subunit A)
MASVVQSNSWVFFLIILFCLVFIGIGVSMLIKLIANFRKANQSKQWSTTNGEIISSELDAQTSTDEEGNQSTTYIAQVFFRYQVGGLEYESGRINFNYGMRTSNIRKQQSIVEQYPQGSTVTVFYDPDNPEESVLERRVNGAFTTIIVSAVFITIGLIVAVSSLGVNPPAFLKNLLGN